MNADNPIIPMTRCRLGSSQTRQVLRLAITFERGFVTRWVFLRRNSRVKSVISFHTLVSLKYSSFKMTATTLYRTKLIAKTESPCCRGLIYYPRISLNDTTTLLEDMIKFLKLHQWHDIFKSWCQKVYFLLPWKEYNTW